MSTHATTPTILAMMVAGQFNVIEEVGMCSFDNAVKGAAMCTSLATHYIRLVDGQVWLACPRHHQEFTQACSQYNHEAAMIPPSQELIGN